MLQKNQLHFFFGFLIVVGAVAFLMALPYLEAVIFAAALAVVFYRPYQWVLRKIGHDGIAAFLILLLVAFIFVIPLSYFGFQVVREANSLYAYVSTRGFEGLRSSPAIGPWIDKLPPDTLARPQDALKGALNWLLGTASSLFTSTIIVFLNTFITIFALFYFLKDGHRFREWVFAFSPLPSKYDAVILERLTRTINSVIRGSLVIVVIQGISASIGLSIFHVPNALLWGSIAMVVALIPALGNGAVMLPSILYLFFQGHYGSAIGLLAWWCLSIFFIDNLLSQRLVNRGARIHPFAVFIAVVGGISFFGPLGFLIGPLVFSLFFALLDIYIAFRQEQERLDGGAEEQRRPSKKTLRLARTTRTAKAE